MNILHIFMQEWFNLRFLFSNLAWNLHYISRKFAKIYNKIYCRWVAFYLVFHVNMLLGYDGNVEIYLPVLVQAKKKKKHSIVFRLQYFLQMILIKWKFNCVTWLHTQNNTVQNSHIGCMHVFLIILTYYIQII